MGAPQKKCQRGLPWVTYLLWYRWKWALCPPRAFPGRSQYFVQPFLEGWNEANGQYSFFYGFWAILELEKNG